MRLSDVLVEYRARKLTLSEAEAKHRTVQLAAEKMVRQVVTEDLGQQISEAEISKVARKVARVVLECWH